MRIAEGRKASSVTGMEVSFCNLTNSPEVVEMRGRGRKSLTPLSSQPRASIVSGFIKDNADLFGMNPQQVDRLRKSAEYTNPNGKISWLKMEQQWNGMPVFRGEMVAAFTSGGELMRIVGEVTGGPETQDLATTPNVNAAAAVVAAAASVGVALTEGELIVKQSDDRIVIFHPAGPFKTDIEAKLLYFPMDAGLATLAWSMVLYQDSPAHLVLIDAQEKEAGLLFLKSLVNDQTQPATYAFYDGDSRPRSHRQRRCQAPAFKAWPSPVLYSL